MKLVFLFGNAAVGKIGSFITKKYLRHSAIIEQFPDKLMISTLSAVGKDFIAILPHGIGSCLPVAGAA